MTGINQPALRDVVGTRKVSPRFETLNKIADSATLSINAGWLLTGKGAMQTHNVNVLYQPPYKEVGRGAIPIHDIYAAANLNTLFANDNQRVMGEIVVPNAPHCDGAIYVRGDSMSPLVKSGDIVSYKQLNNIDNIISGEMYVVDYHHDGDDFLVIKNVEVEEKNNSLRLISYNDYYKDRVIPMSAVRALAHVRIVINFNSGDY